MLVERYWHRRPRRSPLANKTMAAHGAARVRINRSRHLGLLLPQERSARSRFSSVSSLAVAWLGTASLHAGSPGSQISRPDSHITLHRSVKNRLGLQYRH